VHTGATASPATTRTISKAETSPENPNSAVVYNSSEKKESRSSMTNKGTGKGSNSGHWITTDNLGTSTTAPHEAGHGLTLEHTGSLIGKGRPSIMAARGTHVDPQYQYDPAAAPGAPGGTINPATRRVRHADVQNIVNGIRTDSGGNLIIGTLDNTIYDKTGNVVHY
jgi:hypothetical protein